MQNNLNDRNKGTTKKRNNSMKTSITTQSNVQAHLCKATKEIYMKRALLVVSLLLFGESLASAQRDGIPSFTAADVHNFDVVNLVTLTPSFNIPLIAKSAGPLMGS